MPGKTRHRAIRGYATLVGVSTILVIDNYDSFVFNLVQYLAQLGAEVDVRRNDEVTAIERARDLAPVIG